MSGSGQPLSLSQGRQTPYRGSGPNSTPREKTAQSKTNQQQIAKKTLNEVTPAQTSHTGKPSGENTDQIDEMDEEGYNDRGEREHGPSASQIQEEEETQKLYGGLNHTTYIVRGTSFSCCKRKQVFSTPLLHFQTKTNFKQRQMPNRLQNNSV